MPDPDPDPPARDDTLRLRPIDRHRPLTGTLDQSVPADAQVRVVEAFVRRLDGAARDAEVKARVGLPGAPACDPRLLLTRCLYGVIRGTFRFRESSAAGDRDRAFAWPCGGPAPSYHTPSTFFADHGAFLDGVMVEVRGALRAQGLVTYAEVAVDGRKVPASAGKESMHRVGTRTAHSDEARERVARLRAERDVKGGAGSRREQADRAAAADRVARPEAALATAAARSAEREKGRGDPAEARASETDPDAREMKVPGGGFRPAFDVRTATETGSGRIVAADVVDRGCDNGRLAGMVDRAEPATGAKARRVLADAGYSSAAGVDGLERSGSEVFMPVRNGRTEAAAGTDPHARKRRASRHVGEWRRRMGLESSGWIYRRRAPVAEGSHARQSNRGFERFRLRGLEEARTESLWHAAAHDVRVRAANGWRMTAGRARPAAA